MEKFIIDIGGFNNEDYGFEIIKRPLIEFATKRYKEKEIEGHDGNYYIDTNSVNDIIFNIECNFLEENLNECRERIREVNRGLKYSLENSNKLTLNNDDEYYYKVIKYQIKDIGYDDNFYELNKFSIEFTVEGYKYRKSNRQVKVDEFYRNSCDVSKPVYTIIGNGNCILNINGTIINCNVNNKLTIDTEHDKILEANGTYAIGKTNIKYMQDLYLRHDRNSFSVSNGFELYMIPNLRIIS